MRVGLIGMGSAGRRGHLPALTRLHAEGQLTLVATADHHAMRPPKGVSAHPPAAFQDGARMLESVEVDLVVIASEPASHIDLVALAARHGRHVLCEKPLTVSAAEHDRLAATLRADLAFIAVHQYRYSTTWTHVQRWAWCAARLHLPIAISVEVRRCRTDPHATSDWRNDTARTGGTLADHGPHFLALAWTITRDLQPLWARSHRYGKHGETASARLRCGRGEMSLRVTNAAPARCTSLELRAAGLEFTWTDHTACVRVAGRSARRWSAHALSDRQHVDGLYLPLYRDLVSNIHNAAWRRERRSEALDVSRALVRLLADS